MSEPVVVPLSTLRPGRNTPKGRMVDPKAREEVARVLGDARRERDELIENMHRLQDSVGYLSAPHLAALAEAMKLALAEVYEVATFYHHFDVVKEGESPPPEITVRVCESLSCQLAGAGKLLAELQPVGNALRGVPSGGNSASDSRNATEGVPYSAPTFRVVAAPCIGRCAEGPAVCVGQNAFGQATAKSVLNAVQEKNIAASKLDHLHYEQYRAAGGYETWLACVAGRRDVESVLATLEEAGLRGLGGAGFPVGRKWRIVRNEPAPCLMAVNIDEGEPGTFKDRYYLERDPHRFLEGMLIAAWAVGIDEIYIYLRDEYHACRQMLSAELAVLAKSPPAELPKIHLRRGAGAYICGEESAMIESIEGKRGLPRLRPPFVAQVGLFGRPTLEHNMETLYWVREILERGGDWFASQGRNGRQGLRSFSVSGRVKVPGVHVAPAGITVRELIDEFCGGMAEGHEFYAYLPGGASGGILPASLGDIPLDFDTLQPHGCFIGSAAVIVLSQHDKARDAALNIMRFFEHESCGQCTPCRVGTAKAAQLMETQQWDSPLLEELSQAMADASICGLGQAAPNPIRCVVKHFPDEIARGNT